MIKPEDCDFHFKPNSHWQWAETIALPYAVPEANINGLIYIVTRPMLGVAMCDVTIIDRISDLWEDQAYVDNQQHLPCPKKLSDFSLPNGLTFKVIDPLKQALNGRDYVATRIDDTSFSLDYFGLHDPYDCNDPDMDPLAAARNGPAWDSSWNGHYEATFHVKGELILRGKRYEVDCIEIGDRSWGPRPERDNGTMIWWHASWGKDLAVHLFTRHDIAKTDEFGPLVSGYVFEDGKLYGITGTRGKQEYRKSAPMGGVLEVTDIRGKKFNFTYWAPYPSNTYLQSSMRVNLDGKIGYGIQQLGLSRAYLGRNREALLTRY